MILTGDEMKVMISAGGTGGHIYPAISIINKIKENDKTAEFLYIGTTDRMEHEIIPKQNIPYVGIEMKGLSKNIFKDIKSCYLLSKSLIKIKKVIKEFNPDIVIGVGGYVTFPVIYMAKKLGYKTFIHEQNSIPGKSNKLLIKYTDKIAVSLPGSLEYFPKEKTIYTGNPRSSEAIKALPIKKYELGLTENKQLVLIVMGSLGSMTINKELEKIALKFKDKDYEVIIVTGKDYFDKFQDIKVKNVRIVPFLNNMLNVLKVCDLIVTRAGASTIAEITAIGLPSILVPSPYVANNHQYYNALELKNSGCGEILEEKDLTSGCLNNKIKELINDKNKYQEIKNNLGKNKTINSSEIIYQNIKELIKNERNM